MTEREIEIFRRMTEAQERIAQVIEKQQPGRFTQILTMVATAATAFSIVNIINIIKNWIGG